MTWLEEIKARPVTKSIAMYGNAPDREFVEITAAERERLVAIAEAAQEHRQLAAKLLEYCDPLSVPGFSESDERLRSLLEQKRDDDG